CYLCFSFMYPRSPSSTLFPYTTLFRSADTVSDLSVRLTANRQAGVALAPGAGATRVKVTASHSLTQEDGFKTDAGSNVQSVVVEDRKSTRLNSVTSLSRMPSSA